MGSFSYLCLRCERGIREADYCEAPSLNYLSKCVVLLPEEAAKEQGLPKVLKGTYQDYGTIKLSNGNNFDLADTFEDKMGWYHLKCWQDSGKPHLFTAASDYDPWQGWGGENEDSEIFKETLGYNACPKCEEEIDAFDSYCRCCGFEL